MSNYHDNAALVLASVTLIPLAIGQLIYCHKDDVARKQRRLAGIAKRESEENARNSGN